MKKYPYPEAKALMRNLCDEAAAGCFDTRDKFMHLLAENGHLAAQGYNPYGKIFFWNEASVRLFGYSEQDAVNRDLFELILPGELRIFARDMIRCALRTQYMPDPSSCDLIHRDGRPVTVYTAHLMFRWEHVFPEFYCINVPIDVDAGSRRAFRPPIPG